MEYRDDMSRFFFVLAFSLCLCASFAAESSPLICFERGSDMWVVKTDGTGEKKIARGTAPDLSPDGTHIAFNTDSNNSSSVERHIAVADVATGKVTVFKKEIPSNNCFRAIWSPDGTHILFNIWADNDWHLGLIKSDGSEFRYVKKATPKNNSFWSACFAPDGQSIYVQDLDRIYQLGLDGSELKKWETQSLFPSGGFSSGSRLSVSPDGGTMLMGVDMDEEIELADWDGPPPSLWTLDLKTEKTTRLTPKGFLAWDGCWMNSDEVLFVSQGAGEKEASLYRMSRSGENRKVFLKRAENPSVSR